MLSQADSVPCTFLLQVGGELADVAKGSIVQPQDRLLHFKPMPPHVFRVSLESVLPGFAKVDPPIQPAGAEKEMKLGECFNWPLVWPKALLRLDPPVGASAPTLPKTTSTPPVLESPVEDPAPRPHGKGVDVDAPVLDDPGLDDIDDYGGFFEAGDRGDTSLPDIDIQAEVPGLTEPAPNKRRRLFPAHQSQETPEADPLFTEDQRPDVLSPNTLLRTASQAVKGPPTEPLGKIPKKSRKRPTKKDHAQSQPAPVLMDKVPTEYMRPVHVLGYPILPPRVLKTLGGNLVSLHDSILQSEEQLMRDPDPSYPLYIAKVPKELGFHDTPPADYVFLRYDDLFNMFHLHQLDRSLVRLVTLSIAHQVIKEATPGIAIMDPFYMVESNMLPGADRAMVTKYIEDFLAANKEKEIILTPYFCK